MSEDYGELLKRADIYSDDEITGEAEVIHDQSRAIRALVEERDRLREALKALTGYSLKLPYKHNTWELNAGVREHANIALGVIAPRTETCPDDDWDDWEDDLQNLMDRDRG